MKGTMTASYRPDLSELPDDEPAEREGRLAPAPGSVPAGFALLKPSDFFCAGDIVADCEGKWRGPIPPDSDMVGREIRGYLVSNTWGAAAPVKAAARRIAPNVKGQR